MCMPNTLDANLAAKKALPSVAPPKILPIQAAPPPSASATTVARADGLQTISRGTDQYRIPLITPTNK